MGYKHTYDTIYAHFQGITNNVYGFGRTFFAPSFFYPSTHISTHPYSLRVDGSLHRAMCQCQLYPDMGVCKPETAAFIADDDLFTHSL